MFAFKDEHPLSSKLQLDANDCHAQRSSYSFGICLTLRASPNYGYMAPLRASTPLPAPHESRR